MRLVVDEEKEEVVMVVWWPVGGIDGPPEA